jgi:multiple antibiotic resistance protein
MFHIAIHSTRWLSPIAMKLATRIMGLLLAAVAVQFMLNALKDLGIIRGA